MAGTPRQVGDALTELQQRAWDSYQRTESIRLTAIEMEINYNAAYQHIAGAKIKLGLSDGIKDALAQTGISIEDARIGWRRVKAEDGSFNSVMWKAPAVPTQDVAERIMGILEGMKPAPAIAEPDGVDPDVLTLIPIADLHLGMKASAAESGETYGIETAVDRLRSTVHHLSGSVSGHTAVILVAGDFFHADDNTHSTPKHRHPLDVDGRHFDALDAGITVLADTIDMTAARHASVIVRVLRGNHDMTSHMAMTFALAERYRDNPRIWVEKSPADMWAMSWGQCLLAAHHGDDIRPEDLVHSMAEHPDWSSCPYRYLKTAHRHKYSTMMIGSVEWESMSCLTARDAYAAGKGYVTRPTLRAPSFHKRRGEVWRRTVNI
jgi:hypothetical protein